MKKRGCYLLTVFFSVCILSSCTNNEIKLTPTEQDLVFDKLAASWDEAMPLGNGTIGALVWKNDSKMRFSLDRTDLWDLRPMDSISGDRNRFSWVKSQVDKGDYYPVQKKFDHPYEAAPAPSKIPGAALEFSIDKIGEPNHVQLYLNNAVCEAKWENGVTMKTFVHATEPAGWFVFENLKEPIDLNIVAPKYNITDGIEDSAPIEYWDLRRLGYEQGNVTKEGNKITYHQKGWNDYYYDVAVEWEQKGETLYGTWSVTSSLSADNAELLVESSLSKGIGAAYKTHMEYWNEYWNASSVNVPDAVLQKQYNNEMYKFGSAAREDSYPISLQSVWTADHGQLPPWKGDYHHDLNTQLSYWPAYAGNHLSEGLGYLNTLWEQRDTYKKYTKEYFEVDGLNVPGVCTLQGEPMGGWIQYSMSPTVSAWLSHHFYLHWQYSGDREFLETRAYPFIKDVATFLENFSELDANGIRKLPLSSSPEIFDNSIRAWFKDMTNYDLALVHFAFKAASELAMELDKEEESEHWMNLKNQLPNFDIDENHSLTFAKGFPYNSSHRHLSHSMAIHPLGLLDWSDGEESQKIIKATADTIEKYGPDYWVGYSYSWYALMRARMMDGEGAAQYLRDFANHFCLKNTFHANGDQTKTGKSLFTYRPFTLEGNFAFASGIQEMLLQSHTGTINLFPAIPQDWKDVSFKNLRTVGAFLVSAEMKDGQVSKVIIHSEQGNTFNLNSPFDTNELNINGKKYSLSDGKISIFTNKGETIEITPI